MPRTLEEIQQELDRVKKVLTEQAEALSISLEELAKLIEEARKFGTKVNVDIDTTPIKSAIEKLKEFLT